MKGDSPRLVLRETLLFFFRCLREFSAKGGDFSLICAKVPLPAANGGAFFVLRPIFSPQNNIFSVFIQ